MDRLVVRGECVSLEGRGVAGSVPLVEEQILPGGQKTGSETVPPCFPKQNEGKVALANGNKHWHGLVTKAWNYISD